MKKKLEKNFPDYKTETAFKWFKKLRNNICSTIEEIELEAPSHSLNSHINPGIFKRKNWQRNAKNGGGGTMAILHGKIFEKVGVNISLVKGSFPDHFKKNIPGASEDPRFVATGISVVAHMLSPVIPAFHMNTRFIMTTRTWFGGGCEIPPTFNDATIEKYFHKNLKTVCKKYNKDFYKNFKKNCDNYFFLPHRNESRGAGGIFFDQLEGNWEESFNFTKDVGATFLDIFSNIVRSNFSNVWTNKQKEMQLIKRGRYVEFNLLYDRGTTFGLNTGGNTEAILMSLPPLVQWP